MAASIAFAAAIEIAVLTMTPGTELFARFGHTAVSVDDGTRDPVVYNYGTFNGKDPALVEKFLHNRVDYWLGVTTWKPFLKHYQDRHITKQLLNLSEEEAARMVATLNWTVRPENSAYRYDWFRNNCSTKVRDLIDDVTRGDVRAQLSARPGKRTIRGVLENVLQPLPTVFFSMSIGLNRRIDEPVSRFDELAMPGDLMEALREVKRADGSALVKNEGEIVGSPKRPWRESPYFLQALSGLLLACLFLGRWRVRVGGLGLLVWSFIAGLIGTWCLFWSLFLPYPDTSFSANIIAWNPLMWMLLPTSVALIRRRPHALRRAQGLLFILMAATVLELATHVVGIGKQAHYGFTLYALVADILAIGMLRERERVLGRGGEAPAEHAPQLNDERSPDVVELDGST